MEDSVILNSPILWILYGMAFLLTLFDLFTKKTGYVFLAVSLILVVGNSAYALISGASLYEVVTVILIFLVLYLISYSRRSNGGDK